jgi:hypothetical protein
MPCRWANNFRHFEGSSKNHRLADPDTERHGVTFQSNRIFSSSASQEIRRVSWHPRMYDALPLGPHLSHTNPVHKVPYYLVKICLNIILPYAPTSSPSHSSLPPLHREVISRKLLLSSPTNDACAYNRGTQRASS